MLSTDLEFFPECIVLLVSALVAVLGGHPDPDEAEHGAAENDPDQAPQDGVLSEQGLLQTQFNLLNDLDIPDLVGLVDLTRPQDEAAPLDPPGPDGGLGL